MTRKQRKRERDTSGVGGIDRSDLREKKAGLGRGKRNEEKVIYYIHGGEFGSGKGLLGDLRLGLLIVEMGLVGAFYVGQATTHRTITIALSKHCNCRVFGKPFIGFCMTWPQDS
jgi:hypothetical protein